MNLSEREELKVRIRREYNIKICTDLYAEIVNYLGSNPFATPYTISKALGKNPAVYKAYIRLKEIGVINGLGTVNLSTYQFAKAVTYPLVNTIREKILPPKEFKYTHIASYLSGLLENEIVKETGLTRDQYLEKIQKELLAKPELMVLMYELQERLAICSLLAGNLDNWKDMNGPIYTGDIK